MYHFIDRLSNHLAIYDSGFGNHGHGENKQYILKEGSSSIKTYFTIFNNEG